MGLPSYRILGQVPKDVWAKEGKSFVFNEVKSVLEGLSHTRPGGRAGARRREPVETKKPGPTDLCGGTARRRLSGRH